MLMVYWEDKDTGRKKRVEQELRRRKAQREGLADAVISPETSESTTQSEELSKALEIIEKQSMERETQNEQISDLMTSLKKTQELLEQTIKNNQPGNYQIINRPTEKEVELPQLKEIDVTVIDTSGFEVGDGFVGDSRFTGEGIKGKAEKLKALRKNKKR